MNPRQTFNPQVSETRRTIPQPKVMVQLVGGAAELECDPCATQKEESFVQIQTSRRRPESALGLRKQQVRAGVIQNVGHVLSVLLMKFATGACHRSLQQAGKPMHDIQRQLSIVDTGSIHSEL
jgi:hypothetical protein